MSCFCEWLLWLLSAILVQAPGIRIGLCALCNEPGWFGFIKIVERLFQARSHSTQPHAKYRQNLYCRHPRSRRCALCPVAAIRHEYIKQIIFDDSIKIGCVNSNKPHVIDDITEIPHGFRHVSVLHNICGTQVNWTITRLHRDNKLILHT